MKAIRYLQSCVEQVSKSSFHALSTFYSHQTELISNSFINEFLQGWYRQGLISMLYLISLPPHRMDGSLERVSDAEKFLLLHAPFCNQSHNFRPDICIIISQNPCSAMFPDLTRARTLKKQVVPRCHSTLTQYARRIGS